MTDDLKGKTNRPCLKQITFDLNQEKLAKYYPHPKISINPTFYKKAYKDISRFMKEEGFEHRQYSVYTSKDKLTSYDITELIERLAKKMPWLYPCVNEIDVTDVGAQYSIKGILENKTKEFNKNYEKEDATKMQTNEEGLSMSEWKTKVSGNNLFSRQPDNTSRTAEPRDDIGR